MSEIQRLDGDSTDDKFKWRVEFTEDIDFYGLQVDHIDCLYYKNLGEAYKLYLNNETLLIESENIETIVNIS